MILTSWETGEFKELLISRKVLEIELNRFHFWRLCFFEVFEAEIHFFDQYFFAQISPQNFRFLGFKNTSFWPVFVKKWGFTTRSWNCTNNGWSLRFYFTNATANALTSPHKLQPRCTQFDLDTHSALTSTRALQPRCTQSDLVTHYHPECVLVEKSQFSTAKLCCTC